MNASHHFDADASSVRDARAFVRSTLESWHCEPLIDVATLLTSELVTNSIVHARSPVDITVSRRAGAIRISVADATSELPSPVAAPADAEAGRGLGLVDSMSASWGYRAVGAKGAVRKDRSTGGKVVWFDLQLP